MKHGMGVCGVVLALTAGAASQARGASWYFQDGPATLVLTGLVDDIRFLARCDDDGLNVTYLAPDRTSVASGVETACDGQRPCHDKVPVALLVDGKATDLAARAEPEDLFGGYEIHFSLTPRDPFWAAMAKGKTLSLQIDGKAGEELPLATVSKPLGRFLTACGD